jgi:hypothetical protein
LTTNQQAHKTASSSNKLARQQIQEIKSCFVEIFFWQLAVFVNLLICQLLKVL